MTPQISCLSEANVCKRPPQILRRVWYISGKNRAWIIPCHHDICVPHCPLLPVIQRCPVSSVLLVPSQQVAPAKHTRAKVAKIRPQNISCTEGLLGEVNPSGRMRKSRFPAICSFALALLVQVDQQISINWISGYKANLLLSPVSLELQENRQVLCVM